MAISLAAIAAAQAGNVAGTPTGGAGGGAGADGGPSLGVGAAFSSAEKSDEAAKRGTALLTGVAKAYRDAPTISDTIKLSVVTPLGPQNEEFSIELAGKNDLRVRIPQMVITSVGDRLYVEADQFSDEKFVGVPLKDGSFAATLESVAEGFNLPLPHIGLRFGTDEKTWIESLSAGSIENARIAGHRSGDGDEFILLVGDNGEGVARVDGTSKLLESLSVDYRPTGAPPGISIGINFAFSPKVADALNPPIAFEPKGRREVATFESLMQKLQVGDAAPAFELKDNNGETVTLASLKGEVVVLDLWATWCGPCRRGLPLLNDFAKWVAEEKKPVRVLAMNVWERNDGDEAARKEQALKFWDDQKFVFPTLLDLDDKVVAQYGPNGIPTTYIIDRGGKVAVIHTGFDPEMVATLKKDVEKLLN
ncbi:MAG TPA: TlpA disulfide reductase family protein [Phycisphaerales bacterium]|nr:TlpA disulfide reductase family protein [Phycisphaerales bacterium]HMP36227.1 TlpA disulfide reductase family protein [Phycisphaerales bacterium]